MEDTNFNGLTMPVFTAFGWAGEETAINYALSQLELFVQELHPVLPRSIQEKLPFFGLSKENQVAYLSAESETESGAYIIFYARPLSLEIQLVIKDKKTLAKGLKEVEDNSALCHRLVTELGREWSLRVQQMQVNEETDEIAHYQDLFKDSVANLDEDTFKDVMEKAAYLNNEPQWITPLYLSHRFPSEQIAAMGKAVLQVISDHISAMMPVFNFLTGQTKKKKSKPKVLPKVESGHVVEVQTIIEPEDGFLYATELKPLHLRRGFINLTPEHWPFFSINSRTETRPVTIYYNGIYDKGSSVWRLVPNDQARIVLSLPVHLWLEENFDENDKIHITARKLDENEIQISLKAV